VARKKKKGGGGERRSIDFHLKGEEGRRRRERGIPDVQFPYRLFDRGEEKKGRRADAVESGRVLGRRSVGEHFPEPSVHDVRRCKAPRKKRRGGPIQKKDICCVPLAIGRSMGKKKKKGMEGKRKTAEVDVVPHPLIWGRQAEGRKKKKKKHDSTQSTFKSQTDM